MSTHIQSCINDSQINISAYYSIYEFISLSSVQEKMTSSSEAELEMQSSSLSIKENGVNGSSCSSVAKFIQFKISN